MNKLLGYAELDMPWGKVPIKVASYAMENICNDFGVEVYDIGSLFVDKEVSVKDPKTGEDVKTISNVPRKPHEFFRSLILHSANYVRQCEGQTLLTDNEVREWLEEYGVNFAEIGKALVLFKYYASTGKALPTSELEEKKSQE